MKTIRIRSRIAGFVSAIAILLQISPALAGRPNAQLPMTQGSRVPGFPLPSTETARSKHHGPVEVTFTKWVSTFPLMEGFTGGDLPGDFVGEILERQVSQRQAVKCYLPVPNCGRVIRLEAMYEVQAGEEAEKEAGKHTFTALIRGGTSGDTGAALLDGVILFGWRTGARVHVEFQTYAAPPNGPGCLDIRAPKDRTCFMGTIHIERASKD
jgi:hypothetical protein